MTSSSIRKHAGTGPASDQPAAQVHQGARTLGERRLWDRAREWEARKGRIAKDSEVLSRRLAEQTTLNQKLIRAKLQGEISAEDFQTFKASITAETARINEQITALDAERSTMQDLCQQAEVQTLDLAKYI